MKSILLLPVLVIAFASPIWAQENKPAENKPAAPVGKPEEPAPALDPAALKERVSVYIGMDVVRNLQRTEIDFNVDALLQTIKDGLANKQPKYSEAELEAAVRQYQVEMMAKMQAEQEALATTGPKNVEEGKKFLEENGKRAGVTTTDSGLQYEVLQKADGAKPKATDKVTVHYRGTLLSGREFDSSYKNGMPANFPLNRVIAGWTEGVQLMNVGSKFKFFIPSKLAYGESGSPPLIGPNATLVFEVELLGID